MGDNRCVYGICYNRIGDDSDMKLSLNGYIQRVLDLEQESIVEFKIPLWLSKHLHELDKSKRYNLTITNVRSKKTLEQNDMAWGLMREISRKSDMFPDVDDVYKQILHNANIKSAFVMTLPESKELLEKSYRVVIDHGARETQSKSGENLHTFECILGMSNFDRKETARFIESLLLFAHEFGVDTTRYEG